MACCLQYVLNTDEMYWDLVICTEDVSNSRTCEHCLHSILYSKSGMGVGLSGSAVCYPSTIHNFGVVGPLIRQRFLSIWNHIQVPTGQI